MRAERQQPVPSRVRVPYDASGKFVGVGPAAPGDTPPAAGSPEGAAAPSAAGGEGASVQEVVPAATPEQPLSDNRFGDAALEMARLAADEVREDSQHDQLSACTVRALRAYFL